MAGDIVFVSVELRAVGYNGPFLAVVFPNLIVVVNFDRREQEREENRDRHTG